MPTYEYKCTECGHQFDAQQKFSDDPLQVCPKCQGKLRKVFHPAGVIFKGSGFYTTDYKGSGKESGKGSSDNGSGGDGKADKSDSKKSSESKSDSAD